MSAHRIRHRIAAPGAAQRAGERGSVLVLAMVFVTVVMVMTLALLAFAEAGSSATVSFKAERSRRYAVDGALQSAINMLRTQPTMGISGSGATPCRLQYDIPAESAAEESKVVWPGAYLVVQCAATDPAKVPNAPATSGGTDASGIALPRDVTFTVTCNSGDDAYPTDPPGQYLSCGSGTTSVVLATVRVRYEVDSSITPAASSAVVPKIISWEFR